LQEYLKIWKRHYQSKTGVVFNGNNASRLQEKKKLPKHLIYWLPMDSFKEVCEK